MFFLEATEPLLRQTPGPIRTGKTVDRKLRDEQDFTGSFTVEWDETILIEDDEPIQCGFVYHTDGAPMMTLDGQWHKTSVASFTVTPGLEYQGTLPNKYH